MLVHCFTRVHHSFFHLPPPPKKKTNKQTPPPKKKTKKQITTNQETRSASIDQIQMSQNIGKTSPLTQNKKQNKTKQTTTKK